MLTLSALYGRTRPTQGSNFQLTDLKKERSRLRLSIDGLWVLLNRDWLASQTWPQSGGPHRTSCQKLPRVARRCGLGGGKACLYALPAHAAGRFKALKSSQSSSCNYARSVDAETLRCTVHVVLKSSPPCLNGLPKSSLT